MFYVIVGLVLILFGVAAMFRRAPAPQGVQSGRAAVIGQILGGSLLGVVLIIAGLADYWPRPPSCRFPPTGSAT